MCMRGDIYYVDFGEGDGSKQGGLRPALIVSNNRANKNSPVVTVVPLTARIWKKRYLPTHVRIFGSGLSRPSMALAEQVETVDKRNLKEKIGRVSDESVMEQVTKALLIQIGAVAGYN